jgi:hypothetical protein
MPLSAVILEIPHQLRLLFSDTPQRLGKIRFWDASETDTIDRTMYQIRGTTSTVT